MTNLRSRPDPEVVIRDFIHQLAEGVKDAQAIQQLVGYGCTDNALKTACDLEERLKKLALRLLHK